MIRYQRMTVEGVGIFYREAGLADAPVVALLPGFASTSRMYDPLVAVFDP